MKLKIKLNLMTLEDTTFTSDYSFLFQNVKNLKNWHDPQEETDVKQLEIQIDSTNDLRYLFIFIQSTSSPDYDFHTPNLVNASDNGNYIIFDCEISNNDVSKLIDWINAGIIEANQSGNTTLFLYKQNSENDALNKNLTFVDAIDGKFNHAINLKNVNIDYKDFGLSFNYVWIPSLKRYYYVDSVELISADYSRLHLREDVLMTWKTLIKRQDAFVDRYGDPDESDNLLIDDRFPLQDVISTQYYTPTNVTGASVVQFKYLMDNISEGLKAPNVLLHTKADVITFFDTTDVPAPSGTSLPSIQSKKGAWDKFYCLNISQYNGVVGACLKNDAPATYIHSALLFPFDLRDIFPNSTMRSSRLYSGDKMYGLIQGGNGWKNPNEVITEDPYFPETNAGGCPYIVVADFTFDPAGNITIADDYKYYSPNTMWEIYVPFVGWVQINAKQMYNKRIMIYYTIDFDTGLSTAYIYNRTDDKILHSASCQLGMRLSIAVSNAEELARQKQATGLNLIMGLLTSSLAVVGGGVTGNGVAVAGGVLSAGKTIAGAVNSFNQMFERAQISYGSSDNAMYSPKSIVIRMTTHQAIAGINQSVYGHINGYPYRKYVNLSTLDSGFYVEIGEIHFDPKNEDIYQDEISEIVELLQNGVIF